MGYPCPITIPPWLGIRITFLFLALKKHYIACTPNPSLSKFRDLLAAAALYTLLPLSLAILPVTTSFHPQNSSSRLSCTCCCIYILYIRSGLRLQPSFVPMEEATICIEGNAAGMSLDERFAIMKSIGLESIDEDDVRRLLDKKVAPVCYVWCDPSPSVHIAQGIMMVINVRKMVEAGCRVKILIADWFARIQNKFDGDLTKIRTIGFYMIEIWKAVGLELNGVEFIWLSDEINSHSDEFWAIVMDIFRNNTLWTIVRCCGIVDPFWPNRSIIGSYDPKNVTASTLFTPCVHCAGILLQKADIWLLSMDHEEDLHDKLISQYCKGMKREKRPIILSHNKLPNLIEHPEFSKNGDPTWAIFMEDREVNLSYKLSRAFCPAKVAEGNPCLEYIKYIVFPWFGYFEILRKEENDGSRTFHNMEELITDYESGALDASEVKLALTEALSKILKPVRDHFANNCEAKNLEEAMLEITLGPSFVAFFNN